METPALTDYDVRTRMDSMPGNSVGTTTVPNLLNPMLSDTVGGVLATWDNFVTNAKDVALWPLHKVEAGYAVVANAATNAKDFVVKAEESAVSSATGIATWTKYLIIVIGLVAVAYLVAVAAPALRGRK